MVDFFFADDSCNSKPSRPGMGRLVAIGGVYIPSQVVGGLEAATNALCDNYGFPPGEEFKWSPGRALWMHGQLVGKHRESFFVELLELVRDREGKAIVVIEDTDYSTATGSRSAEEDVTVLFLERAHNHLEHMDSEGIVVVDRPGGGRRDEDAFLGGCLETLQSGTAYVKPDRIVCNVFSTPSKLDRLLQVADVVTSCTTAFVGGESCFSPPVFRAIKPILCSATDRIGGVGLKIHPDFRYANLYYWLLGDSHRIRWPTGQPLPIPGLPYFAGPSTP